MLLKLIVLIVVTVSGYVLIQAHNRISEIGDETVEVKRDYENKNLELKQNKVETQEEKEKRIVKDMVSFLENKPFAKDDEYLKSIDVDRYIQKNGLEEYREQLVSYAPNTKEALNIVNYLTLKTNIENEQEYTRYISENVSLLYQDPEKSADAIVEIFQNLNEEHNAEKLHLVEISRELASEKEASRILHPILVQYGLEDKNNEEDLEEDP